MNHAHLLKCVCLLVLGAAGMPLKTEGETEFSPLLGQKGRLLFADDFDAPAAKPEWQALHGTRWSVEKGVFRGIPSTREFQAQRSDHTGSTPSMTLVTPMRDGIVQMSFKLSGKLHAAHFGFNEGTTTETSGHVCRVTISTRDGVALVKDRNSQVEGDADETLATDPWKPELEHWHVLVMEVRGDQFTAQIAGGPTLRGRHPRLAVPKGWLNLKSRGGEGALSYDNVRIWELLPAPELKNQKSGK
ncbi:MAG: hypothetical protein HC841_04975 [Verrucomicrobiae bacterium]|nr:hypothetical protein [Verrucomicrobiae bacterium]